MRLTLRTLLAYLDNILDPADAELLGNKINESEFATSLVHQIQDSVRRLRLDAPALDAQGIGGDLNSVAEYLDNVLPPDQVPALEKACLDDDINLGEVASCHQILTLVLGEAAPVTDKMRHQAYGIAPTESVGEAGSQTQFHEANSPLPPPVSSVIVGPPSYPQENTPSATPNVPVTPALAEAVDPAPPIEEQTASHDARKQRIITRIDGPSTKETWRAEASSIESEQETEEERSPTPVVATAAPIESAATSSAAPYPDYMPARKSSWFRSVFMTGVIALLILAGLLLATGSIEDNLLTRWLGTSKTVVENPTTTSPTNGNLAEPKQALTPLPEKQPSAEPEFNVVKPNQQQPETAQANTDSDLTAPTFDNPPLTLIEPIEAPTFDPPSEDLPDLLDSNGFREPIEPPVEVAEETPKPVIEPTTEIERTAQPDPIPPFDEALNTGELAIEAPTTEVESPKLDRAVDADLLPEVVVTTDSTASSPLEDIAAEPVEGDTFTPAPIEPPVASSPDIGDVAVSSHTTLEPTRPVIPEPEISDDMQPTKLKRDDQLLLLFDEQSKDWVRVDSNVQLQEGDHLLGVPAFKSDIEIGSGLVCSIHGVGRLRLGPSSDVSVLDGNVLLSTEEANLTKNIRFQGRRFELQMIEPGTTVAIEASHQFLPGADITSSQPHSLLKIFPMDNSITVQLMGKTFEIPKGRHLIALDDFEPRISKTSKTPKWMKTESRIRTTDDSARKAWKKQLGSIPEMHTWLRKIAERKFREDQRSLAARSLAEMDDFGPIVASLSDPKQHSYWGQHFTTLERALTRGKETRNLVSVELEQTYGAEQAKVMMKMLSGFDDKQLKAGDAAKLVNYLVHPSVEIRSFAIESLFRITGARSDFRAADILRTSGVKSWNKRLKSGRVKYEKKPELERLLKTFTEDAS